MTERSNKTSEELHAEFLDQYGDQAEEFAKSMIDLLNKLQGGELKEGDEELEEFAEFVRSQNEVSRESRSTDIIVPLIAVTAATREQDPKDRPDLSGEEEEDGSEYSEN